MTRADPPFEPHRARVVSIPPAIRAELDQTPEWWENQYASLLATTFAPAPFDPAEHEGHAVVELNTYSDRTPNLVCTQCPARLVPIR